MMLYIQRLLLTFIIGFLTIQCSIGEISSSSKDVVLLQQPRVGVIDLRPRFVADRIHLIGSTSGCNDDNIIHHKAIFPTIEQSEESNPSYNDNDMDQQAAASHCIGSLCSTVVLMIAYDFENEKTVLHRAFGGTKLMAFVDGTRKHWETGRTKTKLILLLLPSSTSSENRLQSCIICGSTSNQIIGKTNIYDLTKEVQDSTILNGAKVLLERLCSCFEYGGEEFQNINPYDVTIVCAEHNWDNSDDSEVDDLILLNHHQGKGSSNPPMPIADESIPDHFKHLINSSYQSASGSGEVNFYE